MRVCVPVSVVLPCDWVRVWVCTLVVPDSRLVYSGLETVVPEVPSLLRVPVSCPVLLVPVVAVPEAEDDSVVWGKRLLSRLPEGA